jgi:serralysin
LSNFACLAVQSGEAAASGCACAGCQDSFGAAMLGEPAPAPANGTTDVPGDLTTTISLTVGTPISGVLEVSGDHDWYAVNLVAGTRYQITLNGVAVDGYGALEDPYLYLRNAIGGLIVENDDIRNGVLRNSRISWVATEAGQYFLDAGAWDENFVGGYQLSIIEFTPPNYSLDEIVDFLTTGFWGDGGRRWDISTDNIITFNVMGLDLAGQTLARAAFQSWATVTNLVFEEVNSGGNITLDDNEPRAFASSSVSNGFITSTNINISTAWLISYGTAIDSYSFQTYVHEIGHALGLGHGGPYNELASYGLDNLYLNDVWSYTIMSYFDQAEADFGSYRYVMGPSVADILAVQNLYGANTSFNAENTVYGRNATGGSLYDFANFATVPAFSIYDTGGSDTLDASGYGANQIINLNAEAFSSIGGLTNNIAIARGVVVEAAIGGDGGDSIIGNATNNLLMGNAGADTLDGGAANDSLVGGAGDDRLIGGAGLDITDYSQAIGAISVNLAAGTASGSDIGTDTLLGVEGAAGGQGADSFIGDTGDNLLSGNEGGDTLIGGAGSDSLYGGDGDDLLITDGIADYLDAGAGDDVILLGGTQLADILALFATS